MYMPANVCCVFRADKYEDDLAMGFMMYKPPWADEYVQITEGKQPNIGKWFLHGKLGYGGGKKGHNLMCLTYVFICVSKFMQLLFM